MVRRVKHQLICVALTLGITYIASRSFWTRIPTQYEVTQFKTHRDTNIPIIMLEDHQDDFAVVTGQPINPEPINNSVPVIKPETKIDIVTTISPGIKQTSIPVQQKEINDPQNISEKRKTQETQTPFRSKMYLDDIPLEMGFQPFLDVEFPTIETDTPRIPHNIHQIWMRAQDNSSTPDMAVPDKFVKYMETFPKFNPNWTYYFWTYNTSRKLLQDRHPQLLHFFDNTTEMVVRADLMRYVVLYEFGGLYADLDTTCLRPLDIVTNKYSCILVLAPFENAAMMLNGPYQICNGEIFCKAKHPFLKYVLNTIANKVDAGKGAFVLGPSFFTGQYRLYNNISKEDAYRIDLFADTGTPYFYKGETPVTDEDGIYIANTRYFLDQPHPFLRDGVKKQCSNVTNESSVRKRMCAVMEKRGFDRGPGKFTFLSHAYTFSFSAAAQKEKKTYIPLETIIPKFNIYDIQTGLEKTVVR